MMPNPTEHKPDQARILEYADLRRCSSYGGQEAILLRFGYERQVGWTPVSQKEAERRRGLNRKERRDHKADLNSEPLSSLRSLRFSISEFRGLNRRERRDRKENSDRSNWRQAVAEFPTRKFTRRLRENRLLPSEQFGHSLLQNFHTV